MIKEQKQWEKYNIDFCGDENIIRFIGNIRFHSGQNGLTYITELFLNGYCYYFAKILEEAFPGGTTCLCYPSNHIVYIYKGVAYDIGGISTEKHDMYIPIEELGATIYDFMHIPEKQHTSMEDNEFIRFGERCKEENLFLEALSDTPTCHKIAERTKAIIAEDLNSEYYTDILYFKAKQSDLVKEILNEHITEKQAVNFLQEYCRCNGISYELLIAN